MKKMGPVSKKRKVEQPPVATDASVSAEDGYEVEKILDHRRDNKGNQEVTAFKIKWKGYPESDATWEPVGNLSCPEILSKYWQQVYTENRCLVGQSPVTEQMAKSLRAKLDKELKGCDASIIRFHPTDEGTTADFTFRFSVDKYRARQQAELKEWEKEINQICARNREAEIVVENKEDFETVPEEFTYITDYRPCGVRIPNDPLVGCECGVGGCSSKYNYKNRCCPAVAGVEFMYDSKQRVKGVAERRPIYECNSRCTCGPECRNRVVQKGRQIPLTIYRTNGKGWGVKTQRNIPKDTFVTEYVGEVITEEEAERRGKVYDSEGATYLFDLDFADSANVEYAVDAKHYGNVAHFINHSCDPNLQIRAVWIECLEPSLPRLAFFTTREIKKDEELSFNYRMTGEESEGEASDVNPGSGLKIRCSCGAQNCKGYLS